MDAALSATCRVCLASDREMYRLANTPLEETYERVTNGTLVVVGRPCCVCGVCLSALRRCRRFIDTAREANDELDWWIQNHSNRDFRLEERPLFSFTQTPTKLIEITSQGIQESGVKQERDSADNEGNIAMEEVKYEVTSDDDNDNIQMSDNIKSQNSVFCNVYDDMIDIVYDAQTLDDVNFDILKRLDNGRDKTALGAFNVGKEQASSDDDIPLRRLGTGERVNLNIDIKNDRGDEYKLKKSAQRGRKNSTSSSSSTTWSSSSIETIVTKKGKKSVRNESAWIKNVRKRQRNSGKQYISRTGKTVPEKSIKPPCTEKCRLKCRDKITEEQREEIFNCYWGLGTLQRQRYFLNSCLTSLVVPYRRLKEGATKTRKQNCVFHFTVNGESKRTCNFFFINTLGISERTLRTVIEGRNSCSTGVVPEDKRGKHGHHKNRIGKKLLGGNTRLALVG